jgi:hypothetical protein
MYPCAYDYRIDQTEETFAFERDCESLGMICDENNWYVTDEWAKKFRAHHTTLLVLAEAGNAIAQMYVATIYMVGYCYSNAADCELNLEKDHIEMSTWLERAARQGIVAAVDNLITDGVGVEADRLRTIYEEVAYQRSLDESLPIGETWRRAYGVAISERK